jgi:HlyD family secretion protein
MRKIIIPLLILGLGIGAYFVWRHTASLTEESDSLTLYGNVEIRRVNLSFRVSGRITEILYREGDIVEKGAVFARLDKEPFEDSLAVAKAQIQTAEANYEKLKSGNRPQEIAQAQATLQQRDASVKLSEADYKRTSELVAKGTMTKQDYDTAVAVRDEAIAARQLAEETLNLMLEGFRQEDQAMGESQLMEARANLKRLQTTLDDTELRCPNDGILLTRVAEPGAFANMGQTIATLSLRDEVWVYVYIPEKLLGIVTPGMKAEIYTDSQPEKPYAGQVGYISPEAEFTPKTVQTTELRSNLVYRARIIVDSPDNGLRQGMPVTVILYRP